MECEEIFNSDDNLRAPEAGLEPSTGSRDIGEKNSNLLDLSDAYNLVVSNTGRQLSGMLAEHWLEKAKLKAKAWLTDCKDKLIMTGSLRVLCMKCWRKKLRNASAVAANQALAMITRLQGEKATLHTEALKCLRMMEEHSEYDMEAMQKAILLLRSIEDLHAKLVLYRKKFPDESMLINMVVRNSGTKVKDVGLDLLQTKSREYKLRVENGKRS